MRPFFARRRRRRARFRRPSPRTFGLDSDPPYNPPLPNIRQATEINAFIDLVHLSFCTNSFSSPVYRRRARAVVSSSIASDDFRLRDSRLPPLDMP
jgi:hypothetical protein